jgi:hypothetical protein
MSAAKLDDFATSSLCRLISSAQLATGKWLCVRATYAGIRYRVTPADVFADENAQAIARGYAVDGHLVDIDLGVSSETGTAVVT